MNCRTGKKPNLQYFRVFGSLCYPTNDYDDVGKLKAKADIVKAIDLNLMTLFQKYKNSELTALQSGRSRSALVKEPEPPSVPLTRTGDDLFQMNANGSPSTTVISEGGSELLKALTSS
ncbi:hypothetical protein Tco_0684487 [Tanacetum coccineum]|uniref:Integrase, catalytic region, zinc finger, CCHC-type, peptidase aspartic, catalytic n=1 Tax=Tanacetum coccineum TaxID=301880 RepID=A0ABQ4X0G0_9ASTR